MIFIRVARRFYSEESRGRQFSFMSLVALLFHQYQPVQLWSTKVRTQSMKSCDEDTVCSKLKRPPTSTYF